MATTIRPAAAGRVIIETDGCSDYYGGALVQGEVVARISAPASIAQRYTDADGRIDVRRLLRQVDSERRIAAHERRCRYGVSHSLDRDLLAVRVLDRRLVQ